MSSNDICTQQFCAFVYPAKITKIKGSQKLRVLQYNTTIMHNNGQQTQSQQLCLISYII